VATRSAAAKSAKSPEPGAAGGPGSARARLRLAAVVLLGLLAALWAVLGLRMLVAPPAGMLSSFAAVVGMFYLVGALAYGLAARWVGMRKRWGQIIAIVVVALNLVLGFAAQMTWLEWLLVGVNIVALALLLATMPRRR